MPKVERDKYDLLTLAIKQQLIGCEIIFSDNTSAEVQDYYIDAATNEIHIDFTDGTDESLSLKRKYVVNIDSGYNTVTSKKKKRKPKRSS